MDGFGIPQCRAINANCRNEPDCPSFFSGNPCWSTKDAACCRRNDKSRCCYCSVYLSYLAWKDTGLAFHTNRESFEDESFKRMSKALDIGVKSGQLSEVSW